MSIETWKKEFYPIRAIDMDLTDDKAMVNHAHLKFIGARKDNLDRHEVTKEEKSLFDLESERFVFNEKSCALCQAYYTIKDDYACSECPLKRHTGTTCNTNSCAYAYFNVGDDPEPMIAALEGTLKMLKEEDDAQTQAR